MKHGAPRTIVSVLIDILRNDVLMDEFKTSIEKRSQHFEKHFNNFETFGTWPRKMRDYGDYITLLSKPKK